MLFGETLNTKKYNTSDKESSTSNKFTKTNKSLPFPISLQKISSV